MNFIIYNESGEILRIGSCPDEDFQNQALEGELILEGTADLAKDCVDVSSARVVPGGKPKPPPKPVSYSDARATLYPSVADQLDMLWHAMDNNTMPSVEPFYSVIASVKASVPKPEQGSDVVFDVGSV